MSELYWPTIIGVSLGVGLFTFGMGYNQGKKSLLLILRGHESDGKTLKEALDYEIAVSRDEKPFEVQS